MIFVVYCKQLIKLLVIGSWVDHVTINYHKLLNSIQFNEWHVWWVGKMENRPFLERVKLAQKYNFLSISLEPYGLKFWFIGLRVFQIQDEEEK